MMIRVLHTMPDLAVGGGQLLLLRNLSAMDRQAFSHVVCTVHPLEGAAAGMLAKYQEAGIEVVSLNLRSAAGLPGAIRRLCRLIRERQIDLIHANNTGSDRLVAQLAARRTGVPIVNTLHSALYLGRKSRGPKDLVRRLRLAVDRAVARHTIRHCIAVGQAVKEAWLPYTTRYGLGPDRITVIHPGVDLSRFTPLAETAKEDLRRSLGVADAQPLLLNVARITNGKGQHLLIPMMREVRPRHPQAKLLLVGDGELRTDLEKQVRDEGLDSAVVMPGRRDDIPALLGIADVFVFPSFSEGFPLSVLEAMAAGLPIAAFDLPSFAELGEGRASMALAPVGDGPALTRTVLDLLADPERMHAMSRVGREVAQRFDQQRASRAIEDVYRLVLGQT